MASEQLWGPGTSGPPAFVWSEAQADARRRSESRDPAKLLSGLAGTADFIIVTAVVLLEALLRREQGITGQTVTWGVLTGLVTTNALALCGAYTQHLFDGFYRQFLRTTAIWTAVFVALTMIGVLLEALDAPPPRELLITFLAVLPGFAAVRLFAVWRLRQWRRQGRLTRTVAIVDLAGQGAHLAKRLSAANGEDLRLLGVFAADRVSNLLRLSRLFRIDEVLVLPGAEGAGQDAATLGSVLRKLHTLPASVRLCPLLPDLADTPIRETGLICGVPTLTIHRRPLSTWSSVAKRCEDLVLGSVVLALAWPFLLLIALAIRLDSRGPVLFRQTRHGFNHNAITVFKFRTMSQRASQEERIVQATRNDPRVTRVGRFLRRTSLDELPQIFNVLRGDMSIVGPRPHVVAQNEQYAALIDDYLGRHRVQPGITGLAQVNGFRGETETLEKMQRRVEYDLAYIDNWSLALDLRIICKTAVSVLFDRHAF